MSKGVPLSDRDGGEEGVEDVGYGNGGGGHHQDDCAADDRSSQHCSSDWGERPV